MNETGLWLDQRQILRFVHVSGTYLPTCLPGRRSFVRSPAVSPTGVVGDMSSLRD